MFASRARQSSNGLDSPNREDDFARLDQDSDYADLLQCDEEELAEIRKATARNIEDIYRRHRLDRDSGEEALAYIDALSLAQALESVARARRERGDLEGAAQSAITSLQWHEKARKLRSSAELRLDLPESDTAALWLMLVQVYEDLGETALLMRTIAKVSAPTAPRSVSSALRLIVDRARGRSREPSIGSMATEQRSIGLRIPRSIGLWIAIVVIGLIIVAGIRTQSNAKGMIDHSSVGTEYLQIAMRDGSAEGSEDALVLATREFAALQSRMNSWSWIINTTSMLPPIGSQFRSMEAMADLGPRLVAASLEDSAGRLAGEGTAGSVCDSADQLRSVKGNLFDQLEENRETLLRLSTLLSKGQC